MMLIFRDHVITKLRDYEPFFISRDDGITGLGIEVAFYCLFLGAGEGLIRDLHIVELGEEGQLGIYRSQYFAAEGAYLRLLPKGKRGVRRL